MRRPLFLIAVILVVSTGFAFADPIAISATRNIHGHALVDIDGLPVASSSFEQVGTPLGSFTADRSAHAAIGQDSATSAGSQRTTIAGTHWLGSGSTAATAIGDIGLDVGEALSVIGITFVIAEPTPYRFHGSIGAAGESNAMVALAGPLQTSGSSFTWQHAFGLSVDDELSNFRSAEVQHGGVLPPGSYWFFADAQSTAGLADRTTPGRARFAFDFEFGGSPVPEPASGMLLGAALVAWGCRYRRTKTRRMVSS